MNNTHIKYCALTTLSISLRSFVLPSALHLSKHGYEVTVGCQRDDAFAATLPAELSYLPLGIKRGFSIKGTLVATVQLYRFFRKNKIQMVEYGTENVAFCASIAAWLARVPIRIYNHWGARYVGYPKGLSRAFSIFIEKTSACFSTAVRQVSELNRQCCVADKLYPAQKVKVLGYGGTVGADFQRFDIAQKATWRTELRKRNAIPDHDFVFGDIGWVRRDKGSNELISAFQKLNKKDAWLIFVGDIYEEDSVDAALMEWAKSSDRVIFTGRVSDVEHYVAAMDCLVHPSYREGLGMVLQEAGAMGVPSITSNVPGPKEFGIPGESVLLVADHDAEDLYEKMSAVYADRNLLQNLSQSVYAMTLERYERSKMLQRILEDRDDLYKTYLQK